MILWDVTQFLGSRAESVFQHVPNVILIHPKFRIHFHKEYSSKFIINKEYQDTS